MKHNSCWIKNKDIWFDYIHIYVKKNISDKNIDPLHLQKYVRWLMLVYLSLWIIWTYLSLIWKKYLLI